jgi:transcriptional regulator with XRE-family HTH domain
MRLLASSSVRMLVIEARGKLGMTQREFSDAVDSSVRTVSRWEDGASSPSPPQLHKLAALLHRVHPALAHDAAILGGKTLEELGLVEPPPPTPPPAPAPVPPAPTLPTRVLVDAVVFAAAEALEASPAAFDRVRSALRAAFAHARDLRLDPGDVAEALGTPPPAPSGMDAPTEPPLLNEPKPPREAAARLKAARTARRASGRQRKRD